MVVMQQERRFNTWMTTVVLFVLCIIAYTKDLEILSVGGAAMLSMAGRKLFVTIASIRTSGDFYDDFAERQPKLVQYKTARRRFWLLMLSILYYGGAGIAMIYIGWLAT